MPPIYEHPNQPYDAAAYQAQCARLRDRLDRAVVLVGMMGSGKSSIAPKLARDLRLPFYDADALIVARAGKPIPAIFAEDGEALFRKAEANVMAELIAKGRHEGACIIASGGGALTTAATAEKVASDAISIWLQAQIPTILRRTRGTDRPLLQDPNPAQKLAQLLDVRQPLYACANIHFATDKGKPPAQTRQLVDLLEQYLQKIQS